MAYTNIQTPAQGNIVSRFVMGIVTKLQAIRARRAAFVTTFEELSAMSDRELADIAITRAQIRDIAMKAAYGENA